MLSNLRFKSSYWCFGIGLKSHHSLDHTLVLSISEKCRGGAERNDKIFRAHWWEVLCLVKKLPVTHRQEIIKIIKDPILKVHVLQYILYACTCTLSVTYWSYI